MTDDQTAPAKGYADLGNDRYWLDGLDADDRTVATTVPFAAAVALERDRQVALGYGADHDDDHEPVGWALLVLRYAGRLGEEAEHCLSATFLDELPQAALRVAAVKLAAVCAALGDSIDRAVAAEIAAKEDADG
jgi:hypothetical protein